MRFILILIMGSLINSDSIAQKKDEHLVSYDSLLIKKGLESKGKLFPLLSLKNSHGTFNNKDLQKKVTYINFWFKECPPCIAEMSSVNKLYNKLKNRKDIQFISITFENEATIALMKKKYSMQYPVFSVSKNECYRLNQDSGFPTHIIVNKKGEISYLLSGYHTDFKAANRVLMNNVYPKIISNTN